MYLTPIQFGLYVRIYYTSNCPSWSSDHAVSALVVILYEKLNVFNVKYKKCIHMKLEGRVPSK